MRNGIGASARNTPPAVATPFPPPRPSRKIGTTWPRIAAIPYAIAQCCAGAASNSFGKSATGIAPFAVSRTSTASAIFPPSTRWTLVAPRLPLPCWRRSMPFAMRPAMYANGIDPSRYASGRPTAGCINGRPRSCRFPAHHDEKRRTGKSPELAESVVEVADVMLLYEVGMIAEHGDRRRCDLDLRGVVEANFPARRLWRLPTGQQLPELLVH